MPLVPLVCAGLLGWGDAPAPAPAADVVAEYQQVRAAAGRGPADQVRLALWCESHGLTAERARHLALAALADPTNAVARGLAGLVARDGRWVAPDAVARTVQADDDARALLAEYDAKRSKTPYTADAQWALGQWADEHGLPDQARAHFTAVTRLDPARDVAWKRLGYRKHDGRWATDDQITAARAEADAQHQADRTWKPLLEKYRGMLARPSVREEARAALLAVTDPRAVPSIARVFGSNRLEDQQVAVGLLGQVESPQATRGLALLAISSTSVEVRRQALETLRRRDPRDFVGLWIALIRTPIKYEVRPVAGPGSPGALFIAGQKANTQRIYRPMDAPKLADFPAGTLSYDANGLPVESVSLGTRVDFSQHIKGSEGALLLGYNPDGSQRTTDPRQTAAHLADIAQGFDKNLARAMHNAASHMSPSSPAGRLMVTTDSGAFEKFNPDMIYEERVARQMVIPVGQMMVDAQNSTQVASSQLANDVTRLDAANGAIRKANEPILGALSDITGQQLGEDQPAWDRWWTNQQGYAVRNSSTDDTPTIVENVPTNYTPVAVPVIEERLIGLNHSCFAAGTMVRTVDGMKVVERVERGDLVLVQDTVSGALAYQPVLTAFHNPPSSTFRVKVGDDEVVATGIHRFWRAGKGWAMARDLRVGDPLRVLGGVATVEAVTPEAVQPVFNLEVAAGRSFFVGRVGALVHDNSPVEATPSPFDAVGAVAAAGPR